jgi:hypothetical protein
MKMSMTKSLVASIILTLTSGFSGAVLGAPVNLVPNGDFEAGNVQFESDYQFRPGINHTEGEYTIRSNPYPWNDAFVSMGDHTSGNGLMMVVNGSPLPGAVVWSISFMSHPGRLYCTLTICLPARSQCPDRAGV